MELHGWLMEDNNIKTQKNSIRENMRNVGIEEIKMSVYI